MNADRITSILERVSERCDDPVPIVYRHLFAKYPEVEPLFVLDRDQSVHGHMLFEIFECIFDYLGERKFAQDFILSEMHTHDGIGVSPTIFSEFFYVMGDAFREILGEEWSPEMSADWNELAGNLSQLVSRHHRESMAAIA